MLTRVTKNEKRGHVHDRIRKKMQGTAERPRLNVYRSLNHIYVQVIDDLHGKTLVSASTAEGQKAEGKKAEGDKGDKKAAKRTGGNVASAKAVGQGQGRHESCVRPWRLHLSRAREGCGRSGARSGIAVLKNSY